MILISSVRLTRKDFQTTADTLPNRGNDSTNITITTTMKIRILNTCLAAIGAVSVGWPAGLDGATGIETASAQSLSITHWKRVDGGIALEWSGDSASYEIQGAPELAPLEWRTRLTTVRTDAVIPTSDTVGFYRVAGRAAAASRLALTTTNTQTGEVVTFDLQPQIGPDLVFHGPANLNGFDLHKLVLPGTERSKFDLLFDDAGNFTVLTNGVSASQGGRIEAAPGPGANELTYSGVLTNQAGTFTFSAVTYGRLTGTLSAVSSHREAGTDNPAGPGGGSAPAGLTVEGLIGSMQWLLCLPSFAGQQLACAGACANQAVACAFQWPPKASYCNWTTKIVWQPGATLPECIGTCEHGCK